MDQGEAAEDEEYSSPPQDLLALSIQHKAQEGLQDRDSCKARQTSPKDSTTVGGHNLSLLTAPLGQEGRSADKSWT